jgi:hypothetical protein
MEEANVVATQDAVVALAVADLAARLGVATGEIVVREVRAVVWSSGSLGCPQPGAGSTPAEEAGLQILLSHDGALYYYHSGGAQEPFLCDPRSLISPTLRNDEMVPPPDSEID